MSFSGRTYEDIVTDLLTNLTQGVTGERHVVSYEGTGRNAVAGDIVLQRRPVHRVSRVSGLMAAPGTPERVPVEFTLNDYELVASPEDGEDRHTIRFLPFAARRPAPETEVVVSYYPRTTDPKVLTDVQPGSVVRTLLETMARELAVLYAQLDAAYESAFLETATGSSLDRVVALLGYRRYRAGRPIGTVRFGRRQGASGDVTIPAGTPVTDSQDKIRYETAETRTILAGESTAEVRVRGSTDATPVVGAKVLVVIQRSIAGIDTVTNDRPTTTSADDETDLELRSRARVALLAASKGTIPAMEYGLLQLPDVKSVKIEEEPRRVAGELRIAVTLAHGDGSTLPSSVTQRIEELRPAGIRILAEVAGVLTAAARVRLVLAGSGLPAPELMSLRRWAAGTLSRAVAASGVGERVRVGRLAAALLADERIVDVAIALAERGKPPAAAGADLDPGPDRGVRLAEEDVTFEDAAVERPAGSSAGAVSVEVRASIHATPVGGTAAASLQAMLSERIERYLGSLRAGAVVNIAAVLEALRDDGSYQVDPLRVHLTITAGDQFAQVATGGASFTVGARQRLTLASLEVEP